MHLYYFGTGSNVPAISRKILEAELIKEHHWLPQDIAKIPYKKLQEYLLIMKQKNAVEHSREVSAKYQKQAHSIASGQVRTIVREV